MKKLIFLGIAFLAILACTEKEPEVVYTYENGSYKAVEAEYAYGWKGYLEIEILADSLFLVDFDYLDSIGSKKSEISADAYPMDPHPSVWVPQYEAALMDADILNFADIDAISGATHSGITINTMMKTLLEAAKTGDNSEQVITATE